jgi:iron complex outermembrane receptor protein
MRNLAVALTFGASVCALAAQASAQTAQTKPVDPPAVGETSEDGDVVVVTADRREQNLQDYAGTAAVFGGDQIKKRGIQDITDFNDVIPGLTVANNGGNVEVWIRGVGSSNNTELGDPAAAFHYDGVYVPRPSGIGSAFFDIERVEVNFGPQGTLRGRNATAGSVNAIAWKPGIGVWDSELEAEYGNYNQKSVRGMMNVPIGDNAAFRFSGMMLSHDSYYENVGPVTNIDVAEAEDNLAYRAQLLVKPSDRLSVLLAGDYIHETGTGWTGSNYANPLGNGVRPDEIKDPRQVVARAFTPDLDIEHWGVRGVVTYKADPFTIEYTGSYRDMVYDYNAATPISPFYPGLIGSLTSLPGTIEEELDNWSRFQSVADSKSHYHEIRLFDSTGPLIWNLGGLYFKEDQYAFLGAAADRNLFFSGAEFNMPDVNAESWAAYGDATYEMSEKLRVTAGLRYTDDQKSREGIAARYGFALGDGNFNCCGGVRVGTEGFEFAGQGRTIFNPDTNKDGAVSNAEAIAFYMNGVKKFGVRDNVDDIFANGPFEGHFGFVPGLPVCQDTITGDFWTCQGFEPSGQFTYGLPFPGQIFRQTGSMKDNFIDWRLRGEYDLSDDNLLYALIATGHKSGGFNDNIGDAGVAPTYGTEQVRLYEIGSKNEFMIGDIGARLNASLFYNDYDDQVFTSLLSVSQIVSFQSSLGNTIPVPPNTNTALVISYSYNAADSEIYGLNLEGGFDLPANLNLDFNALWMEAKIKNSRPIQDFRFQSDVAPAEAIFQSIDGKRLPRTPRWQLNASLSQTIDVETGSFDWVVSAGYRSSQFMTIFNSQDFQNPTNPRLRLNDRVDGYWTFDVGAGYSHGTDNRLRFEVYANNATDTVHEAAIIITQFDNTRFFTRPLTVGGRMRVKF